MSDSLRSDITTLLDGVRHAAAQPGGSYLTNLFLPPQRVQELVQTGSLRVCATIASSASADAATAGAHAAGTDAAATVSDASGAAAPAPEGAALLLLESLPAGGQRLLFAASSPRALGLALGTNRFGGNIVCNLLGDEQRLAAVAAIFEKQGFARYGLLHRMSRPAQPAANGSAAIAGAPAVAGAESVGSFVRGTSAAVPPPADSDSALRSAAPHDGAPRAVTPVLRSAVPDDYAGIVSALAASFDRWSEPLPPRAEIEAAIAGGEIRLGRAGAGTQMCANRSACASGAPAISGWDALLWAEQRGLVNTVRFWLRHPQSTAGGVAGVLMRELLENSAGKSIRLWVRSDNTAAIERYRYYGFDFDAPVTLVMLSGEN